MICLSFKELLKLNMAESNLLGWLKWQRCLWIETVFSATIVIPFLAIAQNLLSAISLVADHSPRSDRKRRHSKLDDALQSPDCTLGRLRAGPARAR